MLAKVMHLARRSGSDENLDADRLRGISAKEPGGPRDFLEDYAPILRWYNDPANHDAAVEVIAEFTKLPM